MKTPESLEYQLVDLSLSDGINAKDRTEVIDWTKNMSRLENLVNENDKAYVKKQGILSIGLNDEEGNAYGPVYRLLNVNSIPCIIGKNYNLYSINPDSNTVAKKGQFPVSEFCVDQYEIYGNGFFGDNVVSPPAGGDFTGMVQASAISSKYAFSIVSIAGGATQGIDARIIVTDRSTKDVVRNYSVGDCSITGIGASVTNSSTCPSVVACCIVDDRYLHVYVDNFTGNQTCFIVDTNSLPKDLTTATVVAIDTIASGGAYQAITGCAPMAGKSVIAVNNNTDTHVYTVTNAGAKSAALTITAWVAGGIDTLTTDCYLSAKNTVSGKYEVKRVNCAGAPALTSTTILNPAGTARDRPRLAVHSDHTACLVGSFTATNIATATATPAIEVYKVADVTFVGTATPRFHGVMSSWYLGGHPFCDRGSGEFYLPAFKVRQWTTSTTTHSSDIGTFVVFNLCLGLTVLNGGVYVDIQPGSPSGASTPVRPVAVLDWQYISRTTLQGYQQTFPSADNTFFFTTEYKATASSRGYAACELKVKDPSCLSSAGDCVSGGATTSLDGNMVTELGFVDSPSVYLQDSGIAGAPNGSYNYVAVFDYTDSNGTVHYSRVSEISSLTVASHKVNVQITWPSSGRINVNNIGVKLYRTTSGGTVYYYVASVIDNVMSGNITPFISTYVDNTSDASLISNPQLYRQPGQANTPLDRYYSLANKFIIRHKDRLVTASGSTVYYSSFFVDGEAPWFNPSFSFPVYGGDGPITGLASMDGSLIIFKRDAIFVVDGDGPPENGGNGTEFSPPRKINTEFGCIDQRSIVSIPDGTAYRSHRGIEILTRGQAVEWIGEMAQDKVRQYIFTGGACFDRNRGRLHFVLANSLSGTQNNPADTGETLVWDGNSQSWYTQKHYNGVAVGNAMQDVQFCNLYTYGKNEPSHRVIWATSDQVHIQQVTQKTDNGVFVPFLMETGWIKIGSTQERIRVSDLLFLAKSSSNHALKISVGYDYSDSYTDVRIFQPDKIPTTLEQLQIQVPKGAKQSVRFKIEDAAPDDLVSFPIGTGAGPEIFGVTVRLAQRGGGAKLPAIQRA